MTMSDFKLTEKGHHPTLAATSFTLDVGHVAKEGLAYHTPAMKAVTDAETGVMMSDGLKTVLILVRMTIRR